MWLFFTHNVFVIPFRKQRCMQKLIFELCKNLKKKSLKKWFLRLRGRFCLFWRIFLLNTVIIKKTVILSPNLKSKIPNRRSALPLGVAKKFLNYAQTVFYRVRFIGVFIFLFSKNRNSACNS